MGFTLLQSHQRAFLREYFGALLNTPQIFRRTAFRRRTLEEELQEALLRGSLRKAFSGFDLLCLGLGIVIGTGWGLLSGMAAEQYAGPSVILSYLFGGLATLLTAACFAELCLEYPVSGGAFSYIMVTFGELAAFVVLGGLLLEYALGMAVVARGFSRYLARLCNQEPSLFVLEVGPNDEHAFDFAAAGIILIMSLLLSIGVRESALFITSMTVLKVGLIVFVTIMGFTRGTFSDLYNPPTDPYVPTWSYTATQAALAGQVRGPTSPFFHPSFGADGVFLASSLLFFSYVGWDAICNAAEEARNVAHLPLALMGTAGTSALLYTLLALSLVLMTRPSSIVPDLPDDSYNEDNTLSFITAFVYSQGMKWMQYVTSVALLLGIVTALTVGLFSASRIVMVASRDWLLPPFLARISRRTQTPLVAQMVLGMIIAILAMLVEVQFATGMVSFGTLIALWLVCNAQMYRRYSPDVQMRFTRYGTVEIAPKEDLHSWAPGRHLSLRTRKVLLWGHMLAINAVCIALGVYYAETTVETPDPVDPLKLLGHQGLGCLWIALVWAALTLSFQLCCPLEYEPTGWHIPYWLMPWLPSAAIALVVFSVGALPNGDYWKSAVFFGALAVFYLLFSLPMSYIKHSRVDYAGSTEELNIVELAFVDGKWQPRQLGSVFPPFSIPAQPRLSSAYSTDVIKLETRRSAMTGKSDGSGSTHGGSVMAPAYSAGTKTPPPRRSISSSRAGAATVGMVHSLPPTEEGEEE